MTIERMSDSATLRSLNVSIIAGVRTQQWLAPGALRMLAIPDRESDLIEFKESWTEKSLEDIAAFANTRGGSVFVGVTDSAQVVGLTVSDREVQRIASQVVDVLGLRPVIEWHDADGMAVLEVRVASASRLVTCKGRVICRVGTTNRDMAFEEMATRVLEVTGQSFDELPSKATLQEVDAEIVRRYASLARGRLPHLSDATEPSVLLGNLQLLEVDRLRNAGVLLFTRQPQQYFSYTTVHLGRFRNGVVVDDRLFQGDLFTQFETITSWIQNHLQVRFEIDPRAFTVEELQRREIWDYPLAALREATVNAIIHRDYTRTGDLTVRIHDDFIEFWNPGKLHPEVSLASLREEVHRSEQRNPLIAQAFYFANLVERWGSGTAMMIRLCREHGLPEPEFGEDSGFSVTFRKDAYTPDLLQQRGLNERQVAAVRYAREHGKITNQQYQRLTESSKPTATRDLQDLVSRGIFEQTGARGRGTFYSIKGS